MSSYTFPLFLLDFNQNCIFLIYFRKKKPPQISDYTKTHEVGAECFHAGRRKDAKTDKDGQIQQKYVVFRNFVKGPKIYSLLND